MQNRQVIVINNLPVFFFLIYNTRYLFIIKNM